MHYYPHHIGDFTRDTARLSDAQCMAYLRMIWAYYDTEKPLPDDADSLAFQLGTTPDLVRQILQHYFILTDGAWVHQRCEAVISEYRAKSLKAKNSANARWKDATAMRTHSERTANAPKNDANQEPITNNQEYKEAPRKRVGPPDGVCEQTWSSFLAVRRAKKAPVSDLVIAGIQREAAKAGWTLEAALSETVTRGWTAFKADWVTGKQTFAQQAADVARQTVPSKEAPDAALQKIIADGLRAVPPPDEIRAKLAQLRGAK